MGVRDPGRIVVSFIPEFRLLQELESRRGKGRFVCESVGPFLCRPHGLQSYHPSGLPETSTCGWGGGGTYVYSRFHDKGLLVLRTRSLLKREPRG